MCGGSEKDLHDPRRFGALAVVSDRSGLEQDLSGRIMFYNDVDSKSTTATHVRFIPVHGQQILQDLTLTIFSTGDLTVPTSECKQVGSFTLPMTLGTDLSDHSSSETRLGQQLLLEVGGDGVIGRRIAISSPASSKMCMAEGIVGFNSGSIALAA
ncbi:hypothetical protein J7T55_005033 [Diaporthe amygdali]|uniref:uncharacterized protein n=1 Tax=Phomopsis amygdali TaxID=1214568 RepID=UPI0022FE5ADA|nr:uncharacterized protein J7T55_005033 [Diaporthe amygdali]KAJ0116087.1 hypothetical protein J7T55_005033 [Diaporthe amygdali]